MRKIFSILAAAAAVLPALVSCGEMGLSLGGSATLIQLGYATELDMTGRGFEHEELFDNGTFMPFFDVETMERTVSFGEDLPETANLFEYSEGERELQLRVYPKGLEYDDVTLVSSEPGILEVKKIDGERITVLTHGVGEVTLTLGLSTSNSTEKLVYNLQVVTNVEMDFYITPYWLSDVFNTRLRYKIRTLPALENDLVTMVTDSVTVIGYCEYYDVEKSRLPRVKRDTVTLRSKTEVDRFRKNKRKLIRNITEAKAQIDSACVMGTAYEWDPLKQDYVVKPRAYYYIVEQVLLDYCVVTENPYVRFVFNSRCDKTTDTYDEETGERYDSGTDAPEDDGGTDGAELSSSEKAYFTVLLNDFLSEDERRSRADELNRWMKEVGYDESLSEEEKDRCLDEINKHYNSNEKK